MGTGRATAADSTYTRPPGGLLAGGTTALRHLSRTFRCGHYVADRYMPGLVPVSVTTVYRNTRNTHAHTLQRHGLVEWTASPPAPIHRTLPGGLLFATPHTRCPTTKNTLRVTDHLRDFTFNLLARRITTGLTSCGAFRGTQRHPQRHLRRPRLRCGHPARAPWFPIHPFLRCACRGAFAHRHAPACQRRLQNAAVNTRFTYASRYNCQFPAATPAAD